MQSFSIKPTVYFGNRALDFLDTIHGKMAFLVTDSVMVQLKTAEMVSLMLQGRGIESKVFSDVKPDPSVDVIAEGIQQILEVRPDVIIALGGGSVIDAAKGMLYSLLQMAKEAGREFKKPHFIAIPSTSGTGSEVTAFSVIKMGSGKIALVDDWMIPDAAVLYPPFVASVPAAVTADTGMDVLCHALEAYVSTDASDFTDTLSEKTVKLVFDYLLTAYRNGSDQEAREKMHNASCMAGMAFTNASLGINHSLAHAVGGVFHLPHGKTNAILLPHIVRFNERDGRARKRYAYLAEILGLPCRTEEEGAASLAVAIDLLAREMKIPSSFSEAGLGKIDFDREIETLTTLSLQDNCTCTNPIQPSRDEIKQLYYAAY
ncbi:MAG: iron-containing alcohol dehydrogenase [Bacillota bacterium]|jgi:alcohol dehydrogenase class IV|nr:iron-containing alcohol dehydrogenase [Bacillota bacterium]